jgi:hypothetical protein
MVRVQYGAERATVYEEGGIAYDRHLPRIGWVTADDPGIAIVQLAEMTARALRRLHQQLPNRNAE